LTIAVSCGACYSLHKRKKEDHDAENEFDEGGELDDVFQKV
jgi:hypothetical protein